MVPFSIRATSACTATARNWVDAVRDAKKVFVLNGGEERGFLGKYNHGQQICYTEFYTALARTGQFQLVKDPIDADLTMMVEGVQTYAFFPDLRKHAPSPEYEVDDPAKVVRNDEESLLVCNAAPTLWD